MVLMMIMIGSLGDIVEREVENGVTLSMKKDQIYKPADDQIHKKDQIYKPAEDGLYKKDQIYNKE